MTAKGLATLLVSLAAIQPADRAAAIIAESPANRSPPAGKSLAASGLQCRRCRFRADFFDRYRGAADCLVEGATGDGPSESIDCTGGR